MTHRQLQIEFERWINAIDATTTVSNKLNSDTIFAYLNIGKDKFWKTRYSGLNIKGEGFEQSQKRIDDLRTLVTVQEYNTITDNSITLPEDYTLTLGETASISSTTSPCWPKTGNTPIIKTTDVIEATIENIDAILANSLSEHRLHLNRAKPIRLYQGNTIKFYTDGNYSVVGYKLTYLRAPGNIGDTAVLSTEYTDLPEHTHSEIVRLAVQYYMSVNAIPQVKVFSEEVNTME